MKRGSSIKLIIQAILFTGIFWWGMFTHSLIAQENSSSIIWSEVQKLKWKDFQGTPQKDSSHFAISSTGSVFTTYIEEGKDSAIITFETYATFNRDSSWGKKWGRSSYLLKHEQTHFDITELFVRKLRKALTEYHFSGNYKSEIQRMVAYFDHERNKKQDQYDYETRHSLNEAEQVKWNQYIADELKRFESFKAHKVSNKIPLE